MRRTVNLATAHGPLPVHLALPGRVGGVIVLAGLPEDPATALLEETLLRHELAVLTPELLSSRDLHFPDHLHNVPLLAERLLQALAFADRDGDTEGLPVGIHATAPLAPPALRAAAQRDAQVRALACRGGLIDLAGLQYLELLAAPLLMLFAADDETGPAAFRRAAAHLNAPWETRQLASEDDGVAMAAHWLAARVTT